MKKSVWLPMCIFLLLACGISYAQNNNKGDNYNLSQTMIRLCVISYYTDTNHRNQIVRNAVKEQLNMEVVWGPFELIDDFGVSYSSMFVAKGPHKGDYTVVIRGTNFSSLKSWFSEDFENHKAVKFRKFVKTAPEDAKIAKGICNGIVDLNSLKSKDKYSHNAVNFLIKERVNIKNLYVTGHSLGGTLTPPYYAYLCDKIFKGAAPGNSSPYSFAGLTAGNTGFNTFLQTYLQPANTNWRYVNPLDVAPNLWAGEDSIKTIYTAFFPYFKYEPPESDILGYLINRAKRNNYQQPPNSKFLLPVAFITSDTTNTWIKQAEYQHHSGTYLGLVDSVARRK